MTPKLKCCAVCLGQVGGNKDYCLVPDCAYCHTVSQSVEERLFEQIEENQRLMNNGIVYQQTATEATMDEKNEIAKQQMARRSQSVVGSVDIVFQAVMKDIAEHYKVSDKLSDILSDSLSKHLPQALSTLVKEMEGLKKQKTADRQLIHQDHTVEYIKYYESDSDPAFNAGISAAVEVVKKMGV